MWPDEGQGGAGPGWSSTSSDVVITNGHVQKAALASLPAPGRPVLINTMNLAKSPRSHVGDKYVTVTNITQNDQVVKGGCLNLELISPANARRLRCSVAVFVCWMLVFASVLTIYFFYFALTTNTRLDIGLNETWYLRRRDWQAMPASSTYRMCFLKLPVKTVIVGHSAISYCHDRRECITSVREIQKDHLERYGDIGPNFLVGGDEGLVFEGVGANVVAMTTAGNNHKQISIMFLGDYSTMTTDVPNESQFQNVNMLLNTLVEDNVLDNNYVLYGYCQIKTYTISPGQKIMSKLREHFSHWKSENITKCLK